jgi:hypothetical protein
LSARELAVQCTRIGAAALPAVATAARCRRRVDRRERRRANRAGAVQACRAIGPRWSRTAVAARVGATMAGARALRGQQVDWLRAAPGSRRGTS